MRLSRTIEGEIIPRLMMLIESVEDAPPDAPIRPSQPDLLDSIEEFVQLLLRNDASVAVRYVSNLRASGVSLPALYLDLLAPSARRLGVMWENDECSFTAVTIGVSRMHQVLLQFSPCFCASRAEDFDDGHSALIVPMPGEQHTFGLFMVVEFFRREGWHVWSGTPSGEDDLIELIRKNHFDVVGCSVSADRHLNQLSAQISKIRKHSCNPNVKILVGGRMFNEHPELHSSVGADASAQDGVEAVRLAEVLVQRAK